MTTVTYRSPRLVWCHNIGGTSRTGAKRGGVIDPEDLHAVEAVGIV